VRGVFGLGLISGIADMDPDPTRAFVLDATNGNYVWKLTSEGDFAWAQLYDEDPSKFVTLEGIDVDNTGHVALAVTFRSSFDADSTQESHLLHSNGDNDIALIEVSQGVVLPINPQTIGNDLQTLVSVLQEATTGGAPPQVVIPTTIGSLNTVVLAIEALESNSSAPVVQVVIKLADGNYSVRLVIDGTGNSITFEGHSPAFTITSGDVRLTGLTFVNSTDASTILVRGGSLTLQNSLISETTGSARSAIEITGGTANLGTLTDPGGNTIIVNGSGDFVRNTTANSVSAVGDVFQIGSSTITTDIVVGPQKRLIFDATTGQLAFAPTTLFVGIDLRPSSLNIDQNGAISLVIYGSSVFDVTKINTDTLKFAGASISVFNRAFVDDNRDGKNDLLINFKTSDALKAALTSIYSDRLLSDYADDHKYTTRDNAILALDGAFGDFGQQFEGTDSTTLFLAGNSLKTLLTSLGI
jgi:hypothetical protein